MSELCLSTMSKAQFLFIHLFSDLYIFSSFILSHPLYFSYFIFFSPYLLKLVSFLSPLFLTTSLLLLSIVSNFISHEGSCWIWNWDFSSQNNTGFLTSGYHAIVQMFRSKLSNYQEKEYIRFEDSDVFKIVFDVQTVIKEDDNTSTIDEDEMFFQDASEFSSSSSTHEEFTCFLKESDECENGFICNHMKKHEIQQPIDTKTKNVTELSVVRNGSKAEINKLIKNKDETPLGQDYNENYYMGPTRATEKEKCNQESPHQDHISSSLANRVPHCIQESPKQKLHSAMQSKQYCFRSDSTVESSRTLDYNLSSYGSMRKEKEWKRTLACKLFEERHNVVGGGEGMDMLWETYEVETSKKNKSKSRNKNSKIFDHQVKSKDYNDNDNDHDNDDEDEEIEDDESNVQLCCLQAFKFSAGKMNLGMKKPNLVKITKAIKGLGWLHHQVSSRRSKKVHNGE